MKRNSAIIRVDGNSLIGLGHIYRGIALAEMLKDDFEIVFVIKQNTKVEPINEAGFNINFLPENIDLKDEPQWFIQNYDNENIIICDGYEFKSEYQKKIKELGFKLVYVDDLAAWHMYADIVINHSPGAKLDNYSFEKYTKFGLGLKYALIRKEFIENEKDYKWVKNNIFVSFGGADPQDITSKVIRELIDVDDVKNINVVLGHSYEYKKNSLFRNAKIRVFQNLTSNKIIDVIKDSGIAIVSASTISIELAYMGIPMIIGYYVDNQKGIYEGFVNKYRVCGMGDLNKFKFIKIQEKLLKVMNGEKKESYIRLKQDIGNNINSIRKLIKNA